MRRLFPRNPDSPQLEHDLSFEILRSERLRALALMFFLGAIAAAIFLMGFVLPPSWNAIRRAAGDRFPFGATTVFYGAAFLYELSAYWILGRAIEKRIRVPDFPRYVNAFVETSLPTIMLVLLANSLGPEIALNSPVPMVYFLFIILSALRLAAPLSIFTGFVAGAEFLGLAFYYLRSQPGAAYFSSPLPMAAKGLSMAAAGVVCGFVAVQTRRRITAVLETLSEKHRVVSMFGRYVSPSVAEQLLHQRVDDAGEVREVTVMFLDIRNFTAFSEHRTPTEVVGYLNTLFRSMIALVSANHGIINKFLGDGFMACFGAPISDGRDIQNAVKAAMEIVREVERMNADGSIPPTRIGIGLHTGPAVTGSVGSDERKEYTVIGDTVNLASRVEQLNKQYGSTLLVTDSIWHAVKDDYAGRPLDPVTVKGRQEPVAIYALL